jgi:hypothetical protein
MKKVAVPEATFTQQERVRVPVTEEALYKNSFVAVLVRPSAVRLPSGAVSTLELKVIPEVLIQAL